MRSLKSCFDVRQDVLPTDMLEEIGPLEERGRLVARAAEEESPAGSPETLGEDVDRVEAGGIQRGHVTKA